MVKYYSNARGKEFSDTSIVGMRKKAVRELRNITKGGTFMMGHYNHHVQIFTSPNFDRKSYIGDVERAVYTEDDWKTIRVELLSWYDRKKNKRYTINDKGIIVKE